MAEARSVPSIELPFWLITEHRDVLNPPAQEPCDAPNAAHCFTSIDRLTAFMKARGGATWQIEQIADDEGVIVAVAKLHQIGIKELCIDPAPNGSGGLLVSLSDLLSAHDK
jgi:hypothetical protein